MRSRTFVIIALTAAIGFAAPKQRAWEDGRLLDNRDNPYFNGKEADAIDGTKPIMYATNEQYTVTQNSGSSTVYDHYVIEGRSAGYLVEFAHLKSYPGAHLTVRKPLKFAVEKSKLWFLDERGQEYDTQIIKTVPRAGAALVTQVQTPAPGPAPAPPAPTPKPAPKQEPAVAKEEAPGAVKPPPAPAPAPEPVVVAKAEVKETPVVKQPQKQEPPVKPAPPPVAAASAAASTAKDRPWQGGQLLSTASNRFFANIAYVTETDASTWSFVLGSDGKFTAFIHAAATGASSYVYDNYVIETEFCGYLVQRTRPKNVPPARFPGTRPLKFAIEKTKIWIIDEEGKEYEAKIVKQIQKDPEGEAQTPVRTAVR
jgi:hypothetical protein